MSGKLARQVKRYASLGAILFSGFWFLGVVLLGGNPFLALIPLVCALEALANAWCGKSLIFSAMCFFSSALVMLTVAVISSASIGWYLLPAVVLEALAGGFVVKE